MRAQKIEMKKTKLRVTRFNEKYQFYRERKLITQYKNPTKLRVYKRM